MSVLSLSLFSNNTSRVTKVNQSTGSRFTLIKIGWMCASSQQLHAPWSLSKKEWENRSPIEEQPGHAYAHTHTQSKYVYRVLACMNTYAHTSTWCLIRTRMHKHCGQPCVLGDIYFLVNVQCLVLSDPEIQEVFRVEWMHTLIINPSIPHFGLVTPLSHQPPASHVCLLN